MAFVLDASITACWAFADEDHPEASAAFDRIRREDALVPSLWWFEVRNILVVNERRRRIAQAEVTSFLLLGEMRAYTPNFFVRGIGSRCGFFGPAISGSTPPDLGFSRPDAVSDRHAAARLPDLG